VVPVSPVRIRQAFECVLKQLAGWYEILRQGHWVSLPVRPAKPILPFVSGRLMPGIHLFSFYGMVCYAMNRLQIYVQQIDCASFLEKYFFRTNSYETNQSQPSLVSRE